MKKDILRKLIPRSFLLQFGKFTIIGGSLSQLNIIFGIQLSFIVPIVNLYLFTSTQLCNHNHEVLIFLNYILLSLCMIFHLSCYFKDPGIIPKSIPEIKDTEVKANANNDYIELSDGEFKQELDTTKEDDKNEIPTIYTSRFCKSCKVTRPILASHCKSCDTCVEEFDQ